MENYLHRIYAFNCIVLRYDYFNIRSNGYALVIIPFTLGYCLHYSRFWNYSKVVQTLYL